MVNSQESSPDRLLHSFQAPASAPVNTSPSVLGSYGVPSASAEGENTENKSRREEGSERKDVCSVDDEPLSKLKRKSSSLRIETSGQKKRTFVVSVATAKPMAKGSLMSNAEAGMPKRTRMDAGRDSDGDEDDSLEKKKKKKKKTMQREDDESRNRQHEDPKVTKRKRLEVSSKGREEGGGGEKEEGHGALSAADKRLGVEAKKGVTSQCAGSSLQDTEKTKLNPSVKKESDSSVTHNAAVAVLRYDAESMVSSAVGGMSVEVVVKSEPLEDYDWNSMVSAAARMQQEVAVKVEPHEDPNEGIKDAREEGAKKRIKDAREDGAKHAEKGIKDETEGGGKGPEKGVAKRAP
ncbi:hypothetical protein CBR_g29827 [Chara braunii]|uniref:Uncharacterized protein n=1 Tax=Chara braunii TaxID=69332 RepID=A0A388JWQ1_CHABU|nr:hypothetical protein CBR_g29827 [Chara braunii]|eukprot:GBG62219.1 hypothetical protein CBR_g29827 [Chara braunii]